MKNITDFCEKRGVTSHMKEAFQAYLRSQYAQEFFLANGETVKLTVSKMNEEELKVAWGKFVSEFRNYLSSTNPSVSDKK